MMFVLPALLVFLVITQTAQPDTGPGAHNALPIPGGQIAAPASAAPTTGEAQLVGEYNLGGATVMIQQSPKGLQYIQAGNPVHTLVPAGERRYTSPTIPGATIEFRLDDEGQVDALYLLLPQVVVHAARVEGPPPNPETLALLAGTYDLTPVVSATVSLRDGKLIYRVTGDPKDYPLTPARGLHFAFDGNALFSLRFHRGPAKQITHFVLYAADSSVVGTRKK